MYEYIKRQLFTLGSVSHTFEYEKTGYLIYSDFNVDIELIEKFPYHVGLLLQPFMVRYEHEIISDNWCGIPESVLFNRVIAGEVYAFGYHTEEREDGKLFNCITVIENERTTITSHHYYTYKKYKTNTGPLNILRQVLIFLHCDTNRTCRYCNTPNTLFWIGNEENTLICKNAKCTGFSFTIKLTQILFGDLTMNLDELLRGNSNTSCMKCARCRKCTVGKICRLHLVCKHQTKPLCTLTFDDIRKKLKIVPL
jgi:hypothetical protein